MSLLYKAQTRFLFHSHIKIKLSVFYEDTIFDELFTILEEIDKKYNSYQSASYISKINHNAGKYVDVDDETVEILKKVIMLSDQFEGEYDITIMPLIRLWGFYKDEQRQIPSQNDIDNIRHLIDYKKIEIDDNRVRIAEGQEIITGSFIKAYAVDCLITKMRAMGINDAIINAGGSTIAAINNESHPVWQVLVRDPETNILLHTLDLSNKCYSTSSQAKTFVEIDGVRYGHILSPRTGMPSATRQIGIISDNCMTGDIVSTGLYNMTKDLFMEKMDHLSALYNIEGYMMDVEGNITYSKEFDKYIS